METLQLHNILKSLKAEKFSLKSNEIIRRWYGLENNAKLYFARRKQYKTIEYNLCLFPSRVIKLYCWISFLLH